MSMKNQALEFSIIFLLVAGFWQPSIAVGEYERGCKLYKAKDYKNALTCFERAAKDFPENWAVHYYLGNTYLVSGRSSIARREYEHCLRCNPSSTIAKYCHDALAKLGGGSPAAVPELAAVGSDAAPADSPVADTKPADNTSPTLAHERAQAAETMRKAEAECAKIREETKELLANGSTLSNRRWIRIDGSPYIDWTDDQRDRITKDADERCKQIMDQAIRRTAHIKK